MVRIYIYHISVSGQYVSVKYHRTGSELTLTKILSVFVQILVRHSQSLVRLN